jgi:integrase
MKSVMRWCRENGYYSGEPISFVFKLGKRNPRKAFTRQQYRRITQYLRTNNWLIVGKHGNDTKVIRHRRMLREYFLFACNIGMRVGEMRQIRWRDVAFDKTESGKRFVRVQVSERTKVGKSGKGMERIGRYSAFRALERMKEWREDNLLSDDYVFCSPDGKPIQDFREGFNTMLKLTSRWVPKSGGEPIDCEYDTNGVKMTPYCCRHTYITFQLRFRKNPDVYALAENCATSIAMIEQYYSDAKSEDFVERLI